MSELAGQSWDELERLSGTARADMQAFARLVGGAGTAVFVWSMGITQHEFGADNVQAVTNLALSRGLWAGPAAA